MSGLAVARLNAMEPAAAQRLFFEACGIETWAQTMAAGRPYNDEASLRLEADRLWAACGRREWLEAFGHHPEIGDLAGLRARFAGTAHHTGKEQAGVAGADDATLAALARGNRDYKERFGHIFIVCATGKSAAEMLALLQARLGNPPETELAIAAGEQRKITWIRLARALGG